MPTNKSHPLRAEAERLLGGAPKLSRSEGLYFAPESATGALKSELFRHREDALHVTRSGARMFDAWADSQIVPDPLWEDLTRLQAQDVMPLELMLLTLGIKQFELGATPILWMLFEQKVRNIAAEVLRNGKGGGALRACWACMRLSHQL